MRQDNQISTSDAKYRTLVERNPFGIQEIDVHGVITFANQKHHEMYGYEEGDLVGRTIFELMTPGARRDKLPAYLEMLVREQPEPTLYVTRIQTPSGEHRDIDVNWNYQRDADGNVVGFMSVLTDVTLRTSVDEELRLYREHLEETVAQRSSELRASEERLNFVLNGSRLGYWDWDIKADTVQRNERWAEMLGYTLEEIEFTVDQWTDLIHPDDREMAWQSIQDHLNGKTPGHRLEYRMLAKDGTCRWILDQARIVLRDTDGQPLRMSGTHTDVTDLKQVEAHIEEWKNRYEAAVTASGQILYDWDSTTDDVVYGGALEEILGYTQADMAGGLARWKEYIHPEDLPGFEALIAHIIETGDPALVTYRVRKKDGLYTHLQDKGRFFKNSEGELVRMVGFLTDITDRLKAEAALKENEEWFSTYFEKSSDALFILSDGKISDCNPASLRLFNTEREQIIGLTPAELSPEFQPDGSVSAESAAANIHEAFANDNAHFEWVHRKVDGTDFWADVTATRLVRNEKEVLIGTIRDISDRKRFDETLRESEKKYRTFFENSVDAMLMIRDFNFVDCNAATVAMLGYDTKEEFLNTHPWELSPEFQPDGKSSEEKALEMMNTAIKNGTHRFEWDHKRKNGEVFPVEVSLTAIPQEGETLIHTVWIDLTERKKLEDQLQQSQKMEAVGQLAGGVAHDFNNLLQVILGYGDLALDEIEPGNVARTSVEEILDAGLKAKALVSQLLAFSRRQVLDMKNVDLNTVTINLSRMIRRVIGEQIELKTRPGKDLGLVRADRGQIEQILMNLCVNARDAMPAGGTITIETKNVTLDEMFCDSHSWARPGSFVMLSVGDTGCGMDTETLGRIFEPFFSTKGVSQGTGLGLSTVYGLVEQHDGLVHVLSEIDVGTTFEIYLPLAVSSVSEAERSIEREIPGGTETILLAEDEELVRKLTRAILTHAGYTVVAACDGEDAIRLYREHEQSIDLALLDVVMPKKGGRAVAEYIQSIRPELPVLFASGYSSDGVHSNYVIEEDMQLLQKPYKRESLLRAIRNLLDSQSASDSH